jgi:glycosyltransferase involved in cell wall biosynthesis
MRKKHFLFQNNPYMILELIKNRDADIIQFEFPYLLPIALFTKLFKKKVIYSAHGIEYEWQKELYNRNWFWLWITRLIEGTALRLSDETICCSNRDKRKLQELYKINPEKVRVVESTVDLESVKKAEPYNFKKKTVLFIGSQLHPANKEALEKIYYKIIPKVLEKRKDIQFCFIGKNPPEWLKGSNVLVMPEVYDGNVFPYIKGADVCIAPIFKGSGVRIKILEYLACNKPIITTRKGVEGIKIGKNVTITDSIEEFSKGILRIIAR